MRCPRCRQLPHRVASVGSIGPSRAWLRPALLVCTMFNWNDLVFFLELARQTRLMPAARRLKVDHTTVSRRISELEKDLAVRLFERKPDGFVLTEDGHKLLAIAERMEAQSHSVTETISANSTELSGRVRVSTMEGIAAYYL